MNKKSVKLSLILLLLFTTACMWHIPLADQVESRQYAAMQPPAGKALLYLLRADEVEGGGIMTLVRLDGDNFGIVRQGLFLVAALDPGSHTLESTLDKGSRLTLEMEAGRTYYVMHRVRVPETTRYTELERISEEQGRTLTAQYTMSLKNWYLDTVK